MSYKHIRVNSSFKSETKDCAVIALMACLEISYNKAHEVLEANGREYASGTLWDIILKSIHSLGYKTELKTLEEIHANYPKSLRRKSITPLQIEAMPDSWNGIFLCFTRNHVFGVKDGEVRDWCRRRLLRVKAVYELRY